MGKKMIRFIVILALLLGQSFYIGTIILEKSGAHSWLYGFAMLLVSVFLWIAYFRVPLHHHEHDIEDVLVAIWVPVGAAACYWLSVYVGLGSVIAVGIVGTLASFVPNINKDSVYLSKLPATIYCGAFVGMSGVSIAPNIGFILAAGILTGVLLLLSKSLFLGVGGKLGTIAFVGVSIISLIYYLLYK